MVKTVAVDRSLRRKASSPSLRSSAGAASAMIAVMNDAPETRYLLPNEVILDAKEAEAAMRELDRVVNGRILHMTLIETGEERITTADVQMFLSPITYGSVFDSARGGPEAVATVPLTSSAGKLIAGFIRRFFRRIRDSVCGRRKDGYPLTARTAAASAAIAEFVVQHFGVSDAIAKAIATSVLVALLAATKGAFCDMTEEKALTAILEAAHIN